jgi:alpha/beta superfamily hydrolase
MKRYWWIGLLLLCTSCSLDSFLYNQKKIGRYDLSTAIIPESQRAMYTFTSEGHTLYGFWTFPPGSSDTSLTVLYCHGNKDNIENYWDRVELFYRMGIRCFIFDYRGFGRSEGTPSVSGLYADGRAALNFVFSQFQVDSSRLFFYGYSLGDVVAIDLAARVMNPRCLIAEAPFANAQALLQDATLLDLPGEFVVDDNADNASKIRGIHTRFLLLAGSQDDFVPYNDNGRVVFENAPEPKQLLVVQGANHTNVPQVMGFEAYRSLILNFVSPPIPIAQFRSGGNER